MRASKIGTKLLVMLLIVAMILPMSAEVLATATEEWGFDEEPIVVTEDVETVDEEVEEIEEQEVVEPEAEIEAEVEAEIETEEALTGKLTHEMQSAKIETSFEHEGGDESSGTVKSDKYDTTPYAYDVANSGSTGRKTVFKLIQENDYYTFNNIKFRYLTMHKSKGLESEAVVLINIEDSLLGMPTKIKDEKILKYVNNTKDYYPYEEERRLFYVALTRTKNKTYIYIKQNHTLLNVSFF